MGRVLIVMIAVAPSQTVLAGVIQVSGMGPATSTPAEKK
jgi:hypothetical protein